MQSYQCFSCRKVSYFTAGEDQSKCPTCGGTNIQLLSAEEVKKGREHGVFYDIDLSTGKRTKKKPRL